MDTLRMLTRFGSSSESASASASTMAAQSAAEREEERAGESDRESFEGEMLLEQEDVFEDAQTQAQRSGNDLQDGGGVPIRVRAPVSDEMEEDGGEADGEVEGDGDLDGEVEGSVGSEESYDSALERMAASSTASIDTASPKATPVGSLTGPALLAGSPPSVMSVAQQGALMRLNQMLSGEYSLNTSVLDNSSEEEFKETIEALAHDRNQSFEDASFGSIFDTLVPLVRQRGQGLQAPSRTASPFPLGNGEENDGSMASEDTDAVHAMPKAKLTTEDEPYQTDDDENGDVDENTAENGGDENGDETNGDEYEDSMPGENGGDGVEHRIKARESEPEVTSVTDTEAEAKFEQGLSPGFNADEVVAKGEKPQLGQPLDSSPQLEGEESDDIAEASRVMPVAKVTAEDEPIHSSDVDSEEREGEEDNDDGIELGLDGTNEEELTEAPVGMKVRAVPDSEPELDKSQPEIDHDILDGAESRAANGKIQQNEQAAPLDSSDTSHEGAVSLKSIPGETVISSNPRSEQHEELVDAPVEKAESKEIGGTQGPIAEINVEGTQPSTKSQETALRAAAVGSEEAEDTGDWDEEIEEDEDVEDADNFVESSSALAALVRGDSPAGGVSDTPSLGAAGPSLPARPTPSVGARRSVPSLEPAPRAAHQRSNGTVASQAPLPVEDGQANGETGDGSEETREKLQVIRVKFLRLALRLGQSAQNVVVAQVLYRLGLAEQLRGGRSSGRSGAFSFDRATAIAQEQEAAGPEELDFTCTIMLLGKTGVGKSATINSIFDEARTGTNAFMPATKKVEEITGHVHGIRVRVIDTPGLLPSVSDQRHNERIMGSVKRFIKKSSPDIVLYFDRLDMQSRDYGDLPLLRTITDTFGAAVWFNAIVVLTHASSAPPDGPNGLPLSYEMFVAQRSHVVQQTIRQAAGDMRLMNPVSLVENHAACRMNRNRQRVLPNGQVWKPQLLLLCFASKILGEANSLLKLQDNSPGRPFGTRPRVPPLPFLLSSLLQSRAQLKMPDEQMGDDDETDEEVEEDSDSDEEADYDQLPAFRRLARDEIDELDEDQRESYFEELAERERLFHKKQWKEELKRRREMKKRMAEAPKDRFQQLDDGLEDDISRSAAVPVPMPDMVLPPTFDSDNPSHRYRYLETANQWLVRPVLETHGWDHDSGYDGFSAEKMFVVADKIPASVSGQITKDKKEANLTMECAASVKHGEGKVTLAGLDLQTIGKDLAYTLRSETRFSNFRGNKTTGGLAFTLLGDTIASGIKIEDRLIVGKRLKLVVNGGAITGRGDVAYGGSLEATLRDKDFPLSRTLSTLGLSIMDWHGDLAIGGNLQSQFVVGRTMMVGRANLNNRGAGQISIRASSSEQLQMALIGLIPVLRALANRFIFSQSSQ